MKKQLLPMAILLAATGTVKSQVAIGKPAVTNTSVSLEFADTENRGLILPYVETKTGITDNGTIIYDTTDHKVKYLKDSGTWTDLSVDNTGTANISIQTGKTESTNAKSVIGSAAATDTTPGILVLSDANKAMILPKVASPHLNIIDPAPGMMAYDTVKRQLAVYNGKVWTFWKP
ncbi:hypothetical protein EGY05_13405 [Chryseobacterium arthrosphaerae]|uniref:Uncharacterized protein n=1 Tax=Chryseobacterium arthrosphaerae TaxID=651561 RepID=A0A1B8ZSA5_9FLAO|nr:hypothetical protein [Chryseobacterium arthrosphaerae]AYZ12858.1 hypothetical protein EGY05_13405 [Chryseobacterium arthrosphaerae]OCA74475.1 hypothetical protein BBI00_09110 [Chryseobacterium arthrosphaerae]